MGDVQVKSLLSSTGRVVHLTMPVIPALESGKQSSVSTLRCSRLGAAPRLRLPWGQGSTYNTPTLIANATPIFSRLYMRKDRSILHGRRASRKSHAAE